MAGCEEVFLDLVWVVSIPLYILDELRTSRPRASRVKIRVQVLLQISAKPLISASWGVSDGGRGCWALPPLKSPKFMALVGWLVHGCKLFKAGRCGYFILFEVPSLFNISSVSLRTLCQGIGELEPLLTR